MFGSRDVESLYVHYFLSSGVNTFELDITTVAPNKMVKLADALRSRLVDQLFRFLHINGVHLLL